MHGLGGAAEVSDIPLYEVVLVEDLLFEGQVGVAVLGGEGPWLEFVLVLLEEELHGVAAREALGGGCFAGLFPHHRHLLLGRGLL